MREPMSPVGRLYKGKAVRFMDGDTQRDGELCSFSHANGLACVYAESIRGFNPYVVIRISELLPVKERA